MEYEPMQSEDRRAESARSQRFLRDLKELVRDYRGEASPRYLAPTLDIAARHVALAGVDGDAEAAGADRSPAAG
ncbi:MAG: hypothetical protein R3C15_07205 [Thermoleophilia bacterium]